MLVDDSTWAIEVADVNPVARTERWRWTYSMTLVVVVALLLLAGCFFTSNDSMVRGRWLQCRWSSGKPGVESASHEKLAG